MHARTIVPRLTAALLLAACAGDPAAPAVPPAAAGGPSPAYTRATGEIVISEDDVVRQAEGTAPTGDWVLYTRLAAPGTGAFRIGPTSAPSPSVPTGVGSLELGTTLGSDKVYLFNYDHRGTALASIGAIGYRTYRTAGSLQQVAALNVEIDVDGGELNAGEYAVLVFEPVYNAGQGAVTSGEWQAWDAHDGGDAIWWSSRAIPGVCAFSCYVTWNAIVAANPHATIVGGVGVNQGSGNAGLTTAVDRLQIDSAIYDFEPIVTPTTRESCKDGGWQAFQDANGPMFTNQGQCVAYVQSGR